MNKVVGRVSMLQNLMNTKVLAEATQSTDNTPVKDSHSPHFTSIRIAENAESGERDRRRSSTASLQSIVDSPRSVASDTQKSVGNTSMGDTSIGIIAESTVIHRMQHATELARSQTAELAQMADLKKELSELKEQLDEATRQGKESQEQSSELKSQNQSLRQENEELRSGKGKVNADTARSRSRLEEENAFLRALITNLRAEIQAVRSAFVRQSQDTHRRAGCPTADITSQGMTPLMAIESSKESEVPKVEDAAVIAHAESADSVAKSPRAWAWGGPSPVLRRTGPLLKGPVPGARASSEFPEAGGAEGRGRAQGSGRSAADRQKTPAARRDAHSQQENSGASSTASLHGKGHLPNPLPLWRTRPQSVHRLGAAGRDQSPQWSTRSAPPRSLSAQSRPCARARSKSPSAPTSPLVGSPVSSRPASRHASRPASRSPSPQGSVPWPYQASRRRTHVASPPSGVLVKVGDLPPQRSPNGPVIRREHWCLVPTGGPPRAFSPPALRRGCLASTM